MAVSFQQTEFATAAALALFVRLNPSLPTSAGWMILPQPSGTFQVFGTIDPALVVTTGLTQTPQGWR